MKTNIHFWSYLAQFFSEWEVLQAKVVRENHNTHFMFNHFFFENSAGNETMWNNTVEPKGPQMTICRMRMACWIIKATNTHSEYVILIVFPLQQWLHERTSILRYTHIACLGRVYHHTIIHVHLTKEVTSVLRLSDRRLSRLLPYWI
jgi:hypothetical protein